MRALALLVGVMTVLIVLATGAVVIGIAEKFSTRQSEVTSATVAIPKDARVEAMTSTADRAILALLLPDGSRQLLVIDLAHGRKLATIALQPAP